jgi:ribosomal protein S18 acetylase RimI-like enzyme
MVVTDNHRAIRLYEAHGFATYDEEYDEVDQLPYFHMVAQLE